jgi:drug/metabolite transporter (DMT)-like permease
VLLAGYLLCGFVLLVLFAMAMFNGSPGAIAAALLATPPVLVLLRACRRGERFIARCCLRQHLVDRSRSATMAA